MRPIDSARGALRTVALGAWTLGAIQAALVHERFTPVTRREALRNDWVRTWARGLVRVLGIEEHLVTPPPLPARGARLIVANHRSPIDILLMLEHCGGSVLARADMERWPVLGRAAREGGTIFVDRTDAWSGVRAIRAIRDQLARGRTVTVFPEGTTHRGDEVRAFQGGGFSALRGLDGEIVPVGIAYEKGAEFVDETFGAHLARMAGRARLPVALAFGAPLRATGSREAQARAMRAEVQTLVAEARRALDAVTANRTNSAGTART